MNIEAFEKLKTRLRSMPGRFDMNTFCASSWHGVITCIAGHAYLTIHGEVSLDPDLPKVQHPEKPELYPDFPRPSLYERQSRLIQDEALNYLDIDLEQGQRMFIFQEWPRKYWRLYHEARTPIARVEAACLRIDHFIESKGE